MPDTNKLHMQKATETISKNINTKHELKNISKGTIAKVGSTN